MTPPDQRKRPAVNAQKTRTGQGAATQHAKFVEAARALGCDEDEAAFDEKLKAIARQKPKDEPPRTAPARKSAAPKTE